MRRLAAALTAALLGVALAGCNGDGDGGSSDEPVEVTVGEEFTWNDFTVEEGWEVTPVERDAGIDKITSPRVTGSVVNESPEERVVLFEMVFSADGDPLARVNCSAMELAEGQSASFECPGFGQVMPTDYDTVTVQKLVRDSQESSDGA